MIEVYYCYDCMVRCLRLREVIIIMAEDQGFVQISNDVPFQSIESIRVESVKCLEGKFHILCRRAVNAKPMQSDATELVRTEEDMTWLLGNLANIDRLCLIPKIDSQTYLQMLFEKISFHQGTKAKFEVLLKQKVAERALRLVTGIVLAFLKKMGEQYLKPIFIFFHENFELYKNPLYFKEKSKPLTQAVGDYFWGTIAVFTGKNIGSQQVEKSKEFIVKEKDKLEAIRCKLADYVAYLTRLQEEFISEREKIKGKLNCTEQLLLSYDNEVKYLLLIGEEVREAMARVQDRAECQTLLQQYSKSLRQQGEIATKTGNQLMNEYVRVVCEQEVTINAAPH